MEKKILFATTNPHKKERFQAYYRDLGLSVVGLGDLGINIEIEENGKTPEENALIKARKGYKVIEGKMPVFGVDYWLYIEGFPGDLQPGPHVRRIKSGVQGIREAVNDEELLDYYIKNIEAIGGKTTGRWISAIALVVSGKEFTDSFSRDTIFTSIRSPKITTGEPLNSIQIDPMSGKYFTDLTSEEWLKLQREREGGYIGFMKKHLNDINNFY